MYHAQITIHNAFYFVGSACENGCVVIGMCATEANLIFLNALKLTIIIKYMHVQIVHWSCTVNVWFTPSCISVYIYTCMKATQTEIKVVDSQRLE